MSNDTPKTESAKKSLKERLSGKRKGGTRFPRLSLEKALKYSKRLVSKTAIAPQDADTILAGVFDNKGSVGEVRASALKQYGLLEGPATAYQATALARQIEAAADEDERLPLTRKAMLAPKIFQDIYDTYHGDEATKGKIRSRALQLEVHPDLGDECADLFISSALTAQLGTTIPDGIKLVAASASRSTSPPQEEESENIDDELPPESSSESDKDLTADDSVNGTEPEPLSVPTPRPRTAADVTLNLTVDSSLDSDKLWKQLELLRRFGLI